VKFDIGKFYKNLLSYTKFGENRANITGTLYVDLSTFYRCWRY